MRRLLLVAFHFPPFAGSSGVQRALRFVQHLPRFGWEPIVLTAVPFAYEQSSSDLLAEVSDKVIVERAMAIDTGRHLAIRGRYPEVLARPDRWMSWQFDAIRRGLQIFRKFSPHAIWSTYPIATAHVIGAALQRRSGLPWIADFRDPMAQNGYPSDKKTWTSFRAIEERAIRNAKKAVFVTEGTSRYYRARYPDLDGDRFSVIENGYDEETFAAVERSTDVSSPLVAGKVTLLHSGIVYPADRDPTQFFAAIRGLLDRKMVRGEILRVRFRASGHDSMLRSLATEYSLDDVIETLPTIPYHEAIAEMLRADGLLLMQGASCNHQIPAKLYEYLRAKRPIIGLAHPDGDTAFAMRGIGIHSVAPLESKDAIESLLAEVLGEMMTSGRPKTEAYRVEEGSRQGRTRQLANLLDEVVENA